MTAPAKDDDRVIEARLLSWADNQAGRRVSFQLPDYETDHPFKGLKCGRVNGQRVALSFALIDDDETETPARLEPEAVEERQEVMGAGQEAPAEPGDNSGTTMATGRSRPPSDKTQSQEAWRLGKTSLFWRFLNSEYEDTIRHVIETNSADNWEREELVRAVVCHLCSVESRAQFDDPDDPGRNVWLWLRRKYDRWLPTQDLAEPMEEAGV